ncbi:fibroblast growth factor 17 isoform X1 [Triplophysa rosa]|uniref:fibroblast growth factor 17 isoform X1 n=1 Tax=Triplophysa rosa TaxID=992332 RepID=UPI0025463570|nr:fibroblast growth factor 17 isoform X1 [Triplophysa rosa]
MRGPASLREMIEAVEMAEASAARDAGERAALLPLGANPGWRPSEGTSWPVNRPAAPTPLDEPMPTEPATPGPHAWLAGWPVTATLDSGTSVTLVQPGIVQPHDGGKSANPITCVHGDTGQVPARSVTVAAKPGSWSLDIGIVDDLPVPVLLRWDWPGFDQLLAASMQPADHGGRQRRRQPLGPRGRWPVLMECKWRVNGRVRTSNDRSLHFTPKHSTTQAHTGTLVALCTAPKDFTRNWTHSPLLAFLATVLFCVLNENTLRGW